MLSPLFVQWLEASLMLVKLAWTMTRPRPPSQPAMSVPKLASEPIENAPLVSVVDGAGYLGKHLNGQVEVASHVVNSIRQRPAFHKLHSKEGLTVVLTNFVDRHDSRMIQSGRGFGFDLKSLHLFV